MAFKAHWSGVINYIKAKITIGIIEGINNKIQLAKRRARGFKNIQNFINMIYFLCGKLKFDYIHSIHYRTLKKSGKNEFLILISKRD